jgi:hypothetical protein
MLSKFKTGFCLHCNKQVKLVREGSFGYGDWLCGVCGTKTITDDELQIAKTPGTTYFIWGQILAAIVQLCNPLDAFHWTSVNAPWVLKLLVTIPQVFLCGLVVFPIVILLHHMFADI